MRTPLTNSLQKPSLLVTFLAMFLFASTCLAGPGGRSANESESQTKVLTDREYLENVLGLKIKGTQVSELYSTGNGSLAGIHQGDVILMINDEPVSSFDDISRILGAARRETSAHILLRSHDGSTRRVVIRLESHRAVSVREEVVHAVGGFALGALIGPVAGYLACGITGSSGEETLFCGLVALLGSVLGAPTGTAWALDLANNPLAGKPFARTFGGTALGIIVGLGVTAVVNFGFIHNDSMYIYAILPPITGITGGMLAYKWAQAEPTWNGPPIDGDTRARSSQEMALKNLSYETSLPHWPPVLHLPLLRLDW